MIIAIVCHLLIEISRNFEIVYPNTAYIRHLTVSMWIPNLHHPMRGVAERKWRNHYYQIRDNPLIQNGNYKKSWKLPVILSCYLVISLIANSTLETMEKCHNSGAVGENRRGDNSLIICWINGAATAMAITSILYRQYLG